MMLQANILDEQWLRKTAIRPAPLGLVGLALVLHSRHGIRRSAGAARRDDSERGWCSWRYGGLAALAVGC